MTKQVRHVLLGDGGSARPSLKRPGRRLEGGASDVHAALWNGWAPRASPTEPSPRLACEA